MSEKLIIEFDFGEILPKIVIDTLKKTLPAILENQLKQNPQIAEMIKKVYWEWIKTKLV